MTKLITILTLLAVGYFTGTLFEKRHYESIKKREEEFKNLPVITGQWRNQIEPDDEGLAFSAGTVVGSDYFKTFVSNLKSFFGGRLNSYESLLDRGRREAILRVKAKASKWGAYKIINLRVETSTVNSASRKSRSLPCVELFAYGTAIRKNKSND